MRKSLVDDLVNAWPSAIVARHDAHRFSGGTVTPGTLSNCDSRGVGPKARFRVGKNTAYYAQDLAEWIASRVK